ncbi:MAG: hypothetical protein HC905_07210 [Bacteroidales bacterium]|nr:hypothetical protein [Bacteroidales bacterium]
MESTYYTVLDGKNTEPKNNNMKHETNILKEFLRMPLGSTEAIFRKFAGLNAPGMEWRNNGNQEQFLYIPGTRDDKVVLVAHADTVWHGSNDPHTLKIDGDKISSLERNVGLGADDRAGCAILWLLRNSGHSLLITDGEEYGQIGSNWLKKYNKDVLEALNKHQFMIEFDRKNAFDFKTYGVGSLDFDSWISCQTGYGFKPNESVTDICTLCRDICGVNFSVGYYKTPIRLANTSWLTNGTTLTKQSHFLSKGTLKSFYCHTSCNGLHKPVWEKETETQ